jgi:hypothetical protein
MSKFKAGNKVTLGEHETIVKDDSVTKNWAHEMSGYVGKTATLLYSSGNDPYGGGPTWYVDIGWRYYWREANMTLVSESIPIAAAISKSGHSCKRCKNYNEYAEVNQSDGSHMCYSCR